MMGSHGPTFGRRTVNPLLVERPIEEAMLLRDQRPVLRALLRQLETWLPAEEDRLLRARQQNCPLARQEAAWRAMLGLYERLSAAIG
jgi:hypothetical protein